MRQAKTGGFRLLPSYYEAIRELPDHERLALYDAIWDFGFGNDVQELPPLLAGYFGLIRPSLEKSIRFEAKQKANGQMGGRPPKPKPNPTESQQKPSENLAIAIAIDSDSAIDSAVARADKPPRAPRFTPPSVEEVAAYCQERGNSVDAQRFVDYYASNGWMVGRNKMKDWRAAVRSWERKENTNGFSANAAREHPGGNPYRHISGVELD